MPITVDDAFEEFLDQLSPTAAEIAAAISHRESVEECLSGRFGIERLFRSGSFGNNTSISKHSDVDYFAVMPPDALGENSMKALESVRGALAKRFSFTRVRVTSPAVRIRFGNTIGEIHEIVPAWTTGMQTADGHQVYFIADGKGGWMAASPNAHNAYVRSIDEGLGNKVKPLVRFIKGWNYYRQVGISSFYLELFVTQYASGETFISYPNDVRRVLELLDERKLASLRDPVGVSGYIQACSTPPQQGMARTSLSRALERARRACAAEEKGRTKHAVMTWKTLYTGNFPRYG